MRPYLKALGAEALYLIALAVIACLGALIQTLGRSFITDYRGIIFSGTNYGYNIFFYILGIAVFLAALFFGYRLFLKKRISIIGKSGFSGKLVFTVIALLFSYLMCLAMAFSMFMRLGLNDEMKPDIMFSLTGYGWPVLTLVSMIFFEILAVRNAKTEN